MRALNSGPAGSMLGPRQKFNSLTATMLLMLAIWAVMGNTANAYSKFGRGCSDIGCLPNEECIIASESCSYNQHEGKDCGTYPTCKKKSGGGGSSAASPASSPSSSSSSSSSFGSKSPGEHTYNPVAPSAPHPADNNPAGHGAGYSAGGHSMYPGLPSNAGGGAYNPYGGYNPQQGYNPQPGYNPQAGYNPYQGGYNPYQGGYQQPGAGAGGYAPGSTVYTPPAPGYDQKQKDKEGGGFFSKIFADKTVRDAVSGIIGDQISKALRGGGGGGGAAAPANNAQPYNGGSSSGSSGGSSLGGLFNSFLSGGGGSGSSGGGGGGGGDNSASKFLGSLLSGAAGGGGASSGGSAASELFSAKNLGGLFSEKPSSHGSYSNADPNAPRSYPTQAPYYG